MFFIKKILLLFILSAFSFSSYGNGKCEPKFSNNDQTNHESDLNKNIKDVLSLNEYVNTVLSHAGLNRMGDLVQRTETDILNISGIGPKSLQMIKDELEKKGFALAEESKPSVVRRTAESLLSTAQTVGHRADQVVGFSQAVKQARASQQEAQSNRIQQTALKAIETGNPHLVRSALPENASRAQRALQGAAFVSRVGLSVVGNVASQAAQRVRKPKDSTDTAPTDKPAEIPQTAQTDEPAKPAVAEQTQAAESGTSGNKAERNQADYVRSFWSQTLRGSQPADSPQADKPATNISSYDRKPEDDRLPTLAEATEAHRTRPIHTNEVWMDEQGNVIPKPSRLQRTVDSVDRTVGFSQAVEQARASQQEAPENAGRTRRALRGAALVGQVGLNVADHVARQAVQRVRRSDEESAENHFVMNQQEMFIFSRFTGELITSDTRQEILNTLEQNGLRTYEDLALRTRSELLSIEGMYPLYVDSISAILKSRNLSLGMTEAQIADVKSSAATKNQTAQDGEPTTEAFQVERQRILDESGEVTEGYARDTVDQGTQATEEARPGILQRTAQSVLSTATAQAVDQTLGISQAVEQVRASQPETPENAGRTQRAVQGATFVGQVGLNVAGNVASQAAQRVRRSKDSDETQPTAEAKPTDTQMLKLLPIPNLMQASPLLTKPLKLATITLIKTLVTKHKLKTNYYEIFNFSDFLKER